MIDQNFWHQRKVFITGHTGFKGGWLGLWLKKLGAQVTGYALQPDTTPNLFSLLGCQQVCDRSIIADIRDLSALKQALIQSEAEIVFHLAAQPLVRRSYADPIETFSTNIIGTANLLEAVRQAPTVLSVINVTSDKCYENQGFSRGYIETDPMGGHDPYSASKGCSELITSAYQRSYLQDQGISVASARAGNVMGGGDWSGDRLLPDAIRAFSEGHPLHLRAPGSIRPWQHVLEPLAGYLLLGQKIDATSTAQTGWNFGPDESGAASVESVIELAAEAWGNGAAYTVADRAPDLHEAAVLVLDSSAAKLHLGWQPKLTLRESIRYTIDWYKAFFSEKDLLQLSHQQIDEYSSR
ncbi:CDP-glucose 4,6-dehydratase [Neptuniibacter halophilus]|uniref:CDP-glucose 4,6-dehydratase n=1 Tax=Neptuniibacter halophilus TaxID=651666 RepID=UPI0025724131|nr:CDP-glucose 4,6-dehydratase [Neptuniibacter halophilus]